MRANDAYQLLGGPPRSVTGLLTAAIVARFASMTEATVRRACGHGLAQVLVGDQILVVGSWRWFGSPAGTRPLPFERHRENEET